MTGIRRACTRAAILLSLLWLVSACVSSESWEATRLLQDIDAGAGPSALKTSTPTPSRRTLDYVIDGRTGWADLYQPHQPIGGALVLVPGFTRYGKNDPRVIALARSMARARFLVLVPDLPGSRQVRVRLDDAQYIADAMRYLARHQPQAATEGVAVVAISYAVGLAVLASLQAQPEVPLHFLVGIGGYYDSTAIVIFATTGKFRLPGGRDWRSGAPLSAAKWIFLASNTGVLSSAEDRQRLEAIAERCLRSCDESAEALGEGLGPEGRSLLALITNKDPDRVPQLLADLPASVTAQLERLSLRSHDLSMLSGRVILVHGRLDPMIPYSESLTFGRAVPQTEVFVIDGFSHIDPKGVGWAGQLQLIGAIQAVLRRRRPSPP